MNKKVLFLVGGMFLLFAGTLIVLVLMKGTSSNTTTETPDTTTNTTTDGTQNDSGNPKSQGDNVFGGSQAIKLTDYGVISPVSQYSGSGLSFLTTDGKLIQADLKGEDGQMLISNQRTVTLPSTPSATRVIWPPAYNNAIFENSASGNKIWSVLSSDTNSLSQLPTNVTAVAWMPSGKELLYIWKDKNGKSTLYLATPDNSHYQQITDMWEPDDDIVVSPDQKHILYWRRGNTGQTNELNMMGVDGKSFSTLVKTGYNIGGVWSPDSQKVLYYSRVVPDNQSKLNVYDLKTKQSKSFDVNGDIKSAIWSKDGTRIFVFGRLINDAQGTSKILEVDTASGQVTQFNLSSNIQASDLFLSQDEQFILFKNLTDTFLYYIPLSK